MSEKANHTRWCDKNPNRNIWDKNKQTINQYGSLRYHKDECIICGFKEIISVHHIDENHENNDQMDLVVCAQIIIIWYIHQNIVKKLLTL